MAVREVIKMGHPLLWQAAAPIAQEEFGSSALQALITDMQDTMRALNGAGLAAPQIGVGKQLLIFGGFTSPRYPQAGEIPYTILCNPQIHPLSEQMEEDWEGCLSIPGLRGKVARYSHIRYQGQDPAGRPLEREVQGFHARVVQHEYDHLIGTLYPMRIQDMRQFGFVDVVMPELAAQA